MQQIVKRIYEIQLSYRTMGPFEKTSNVLKFPHKGGILLPHMNRRTPQYRLLQLSKFDFPLECGDNCVMLSDETIVNIENFVSLF